MFCDFVSCLLGFKGRLAFLTVQQSPVPVGTLTRWGVHDCHPTCQGEKNPALLIQARRRGDPPLQDGGGSVPSPKHLGSFEYFPGGAKKEQIDVDVTLDVLNFKATGGGIVKFVPSLAPCYLEHVEPALKNKAA